MGNPLKPYSLLSTGDRALGGGEDQVRFGFCDRIKADSILWGFSIPYLQDGQDNFFLPGRQKKRINLNLLHTLGFLYIAEVLKYLQCIFTWPKAMDFTRRHPGGGYNSIYPPDPVNPV